MKTTSARGIGRWVALALIAISAATAVARPPNIVFILADDLGYMDIRANNPETFYETPNIDRLASSGMRFTRGYSACPVCSPTRASILTGRYPQRTGITDFIGGTRVGKLKPAPNKNHLGLEEVTIAERLRDAGYARFFAGKWHLGADEYGPGAQGFERCVGESGQFFYPENAGGSDPAADPKNSERIADAAVRFIEANKANPFFAYLPFLAPHVPIKAPAGLVEKYEKKRATAAPDAWGEERGNRVRLVQNSAVYAAMIEQLDAAVGRVIDATEKHGVAGQTIVIFTSDNGGLSTAEGHPTSNVPLRGGKGWLYEGGIRVPWILRAPGITTPGSVCDTPVISNDFFPTLLELAGLPVSSHQSADGLSIVPLLKGGSVSRAAPLFWHYPHYSNQGGPPGGAVRAGDWKLIEWYEDGGIELFNLRDDPAEKTSLAAAQPDKVNELRSKLVAFRSDVGALMPVPHP
jgi:arylsulfatase A-like enzyme